MHLIYKEMKYLPILLLLSCSPIHQLERQHTLPANNLIENYYEVVVWNRENSTRLEVKNIKSEVKQYLLIEPPKEQ